MRSWRWELAVMMSLGFASGGEAQGRAVIAVLPFENGGSYGQDKEVFEAFELGVPAMLARELDDHPALEAAERGRVNRALEAAGLGPAQRIDASSAAQVAKAVGARYAVTGSFADFYGKFRINARLVDAANGEILKVVSNDDPKQQDRAQLAAILRTVSDRLVTAAGLPEDSEASSVTPTEAITDYSRGLLHESRGDRAKALEFYRRAVTASPGFQEAQAGVRRLGGS